MNLEHLPLRRCVRSVRQTHALAAGLTAAMGGHGVIALYGGLGAGKTTFTQGLALAMGVCSPVTSPTFALVCPHRGRQGTLIHMDLYRIRTPDELTEIGFDDLIGDPNALTAIEWAEHAGDGLPPHTMHVHITVRNDHRHRYVTISRTPPFPPH